MSSHPQTQPGVHPLTPSAAPAEWSPYSWRSRPSGMPINYPDTAALQTAIAKLTSLPPLVTSFEITKLKNLIADAQEGKRFLLWGGDCAEALADCRPDVVTSKLKILLQMSVVLVYGGKRPVIRVGRMAGQYAKPRSSPLETKTVNGAPLSLPSYFGDLVNRAEFTLESRTPDPSLLLDAYAHSAVTLNFIRSLVDAGFADAHHPEYWDLGFLQHAGLSAELREDYQKITRRIADGVEFLEAVGEATIGDMARVDFFVSHEGLNLEYEAAQTRTVPRRSGFWNLTTHLPWVGERTRQLGGAHIEYFRGINNPVGVKVGPKTTTSELLTLIDTLNPSNEPGKLVLIPRMGVAHIDRALPPMLDAVKSAGKRVLWVCDPMHGNGIVTSTGVKTRRFTDILQELERSAEIHQAAGIPLGGAHIELTGEDVTECLGGAANLTESDLSANYNSACDPRLNYQQALELAFVLARKMAGSRKRL